ncbi:MAG TPA: hypothetical protein VEX68_14820 [Bryobacteraceae bacterium]|nr:hypothetical protein [Bryobacteraceae bacterium]
MLFRYALVAALALPVFAFDDNDDRRRGRGWSKDSRDDWDRFGRNSRNSRDPYSRDPYSRGDRGYGYGNGNYGNGGYGARGDYSVIDRTLRDLQVAASRNRVDGHERGHFNRAISDLQQMRYSSRNGGVDAGRLNRVLDDLDDLSRADQVHPRDRQILARDMQALRSLRW